MRSILFNVRPELAEKERDTLLEKVKRVPGVNSAAPLSPKANSAGTRRMHFAYVADDADINAVLGQISAQPEVESASLPAERRLA
jgi:hypothetical protein